jgi:hypothetical protein
VLGNFTSLFNGLLVITDPELFSDTSTKLAASALGSELGATGVAYSPCVIVAGPAGAAIYAEAISIAPQVRDRSPLCPLPNASTESAQPFLPAHVQ